jgi:hypothetical protein
LAQEVTGMVHGATAVTKAEKAADVLFGGDLEGLDAIDIREIFADVPSSQLAQTMFEGDGCPVVDLLVHSGLASSKGDARRSIQGGGIYLNNERVSDQMQTATLSQSIEGQFMVLRRDAKGACDALDRAVELGHPHEARRAAFHLWRGRARELRGAREDACRDTRTALALAADPSIHAAAKRDLRKPYKMDRTPRIQIDFSMADVVTA